jgi:hypothetical protein
LSLAFALLLISIAASPILAVFDSLIVQSIVAIVVLSTLATVGVTARAPDVNFAARTTRYLGVAAAIPAIWMVIQLLPIPLGYHSIWINANEALNQQSWGHISVDLGATIDVIASYLSTLALIIVVLFVTRDRQRAELLLFALTAITILTTIILLVTKFTQGTGHENDVLAAFGSFGLILSLTLAVTGAERYENKRSEALPQHIQLAFVFATLGSLVSIAGLAAAATLNIALTTLFGLGIFASVQAIRRTGLPNWAAGIVLATIVVAAAMIILWRYDLTRPLSPLLQFATQAPADALSMAQRILSDTTWRGTGAGTYAQLAPIYGELGNSTTGAPTTIAAFAIELGWPVTLFVAAVALWLTIALYRGALARGRGSFYPAAATAIAVTIVGQAFCNASLLATSVAVIASVMIGLGLAQSVSSGENF